MFNWQDFLGDLSGYKLKYERCSANYAGCSINLKDVGSRLIKAENTIKQLELLVPRPAPPKLDYIVEKDSVWVGGVLAKMEAKVIRLPLGPEFRLVDKDTFIDFIAWDWIDSLLLEPQTDNLFCWQEHAPQFYNLKGAEVII